MGSKILVVDDEPDVAKGWAKALKLAGHDVLVAFDSEKATELSREHPLDLVILDYMMPSVTGVELLNEIRKDHPFVRSIIISGKIDSSISEQAILLGIRGNIDADLYLHKPVQNVRLREEVANLLARNPETDWKAIAKTKLEAAARRGRVRAAEKVLNRKKTKK